MSKDDEPGQPKNAILEMIKNELELEHQYKAETRTIKVSVNSNVLMRPCFQISVTEQEHQAPVRTIRELTVDLTFSESAEDGMPKGRQQVVTDAKKKSELIPKPTPNSKLTNHSQVQEPAQKVNEPVSSQKSL